MKLGSHISCSRECRRVWGNEPSTLPSELPLWELESQWTFEFLESHFKGQNWLHWRVPYTIEKILEHRYLKWACMTHLGTSNISYGQKKGWKSNCQFDSWPLKVKNRPDLLAHRWHVTYCSKAINKGYKFSLNLILIKGLHKKLWASKFAGVPILGKLRVSRQNDIWVLAPWLGIKNIIKGEVVASPKFGPWWVLWVRVCLWLVCAPKVL